MMLDNNYRPTLADYSAKGANGKDAPGLGSMPRATFRAALTPCGSKPCRVCAGRRKHAGAKGEAA